MARGSAKHLDEDGVGSYFNHQGGGGGEGLGLGL